MYLLGDSGGWGLCPSSQKLDIFWRMWVRQTLSWPYPLFPPLSLFLFPPLLLPFPSIPLLTLPSTLFIIPHSICPPTSAPDRATRPAIEVEIWDFASGTVFEFQHCYMCVLAHSGMLRMPAKC